MPKFQAFILVVVAIFTTQMAPIASANPIVGTIGFVVSGNITPATGSLNTSFSLATIETSNSASGDWVQFNTGIPVAALMQFAAFPSTGGSFSFSDAGFGSYSGTVQSDSGQVGNTQFALRQISILGQFNPGTTLSAQGFTSPVAGQLDLIIQSVNGGARSASMLFGTSAVPEPGSMALASIGVAFLAARMRKSRRMRSAY